MNLRQISLGTLASAILFGAGWQVGVQNAHTLTTESISVESQTLANASSWSMVCDGMVVCQPFTPAPSLTPSRTPTQRPATVTQAPSATRTATATATPLEVTPLGTPSYPRYVQADREYVPLTRLLIRRDPFKANNWTGVYANAGTRYRIYHVREYADGSVWGCMDANVHPANCTRWFVIKADLAGPAPSYSGLPDGKIEDYAEEAPELDG
jgi:hypothetical protein